MTIYRDESLLCPTNLVTANLLVPGQYYFWQYNALVILFQCISPWSDQFICAKFIVYNGRLTHGSSNTILYIKRCSFYKIENPVFKEIKKSRIIAPVTLRMLAFNQLDDITKLEYSYAANVRGQFPPIPPDYSG